MQSHFDVSLCIIGIRYLTYSMVFWQKASATGIKAAVAEIQKEKTISENKIEDEPAEDVTDL